MRFLLGLSIAMSLMFISPTQANQKPTPPDKMKGLITQYINLIDNAESLSQLEPLFKTIHPQFEYHHQRFATRYDALQWQQTLIARIEQPKITRQIETQIVKIEFALNAAFVHQASRWQQLKNDQWYPRVQNNIKTLFEFKEGKISVVREYW